MKHIGLFQEKSAFSLNLKRKAKNRETQVFDHLMSRLHAFSGMSEGLSVAM